MISTSDGTGFDSTKPPAAAAGGESTLNLLMDMELPLMVRFGSTKMPMRDLLKLTAGSAIEVGRSGTSPVEGLVNGRVVDRGTAEGVPGHYGGWASEYRTSPQG